MKIQLLTKISLLATLTFISSYFTIPIGPAPFTTQTFFVALTGLILKPKAAFLTQFINMILLFIFKGGFSLFFGITGVTGGFILGFIANATLISLLTYHKKQNSLLRIIVAVALGSISLYCIGIPYLANILNISLYKALTLAFVPFIIVDILKALTAILIFKRLNQLIPNLYN